MFRKLVLILVLSTALVGVIVTPAAAASTTNATTSGTSSPTTANATNASLIHQGVGADLGTVTFQRWTYDKRTGALTLYLRAKVYTPIAISDAGRANQRQAQANGRGGQRVPVTRKNLHRGENKVVVHPHVYDGGHMAVTVGTTGDAYRIWTRGLPTSHHPVSYKTARNLVIVAALGAVGMTIGLVHRRANQEDKEVRRER